MDKDTKDINGGGVRVGTNKRVFVLVVNLLLAKNLIGANYIML